MIMTTPFGLLFGEKARLPSFLNEEIQKLQNGKTSAAKCFNLLQKLRKMAHQFVTENGEKTKMQYDKHSSAHKFKIGNKVLLANDFYTGKNQNLHQITKAPPKSLTLMTLLLKLK